MEKEYKSMKIKTSMFQFIALFLIFSANYGFSSDRDESDQSKTNSGYTKIETTKSGNQETATYSSLSKDCVSAEKCTETKVQK